MKVKKLLLILAITVLINVMFTINSYAAKGTVTGNTVRVRENASTDSEIVTNVFKDDKVTVLEKSGDWYKVKYEEFEGYVYGEYLKVDGEITETNTKDENEEETPVSSTEVEQIKIGEKYEINENAKLYIIPVLYASVIEELNSDDSVTVIQTANNWVYVETQRYTGWIVKAAIEKSTSETNENTNQQEEDEPQKPEEEEPKPEKEPEKETTQEPEEPLNKVGYINVEQANVREGPAVKYEHVVTGKLNQEVKILGEENGWYKIEIKDVTGYINKKLVSDEKVEVTPSRGMTDSRTNEEEQPKEEKVEEKQPETTPKETAKEDTENKETVEEPKVETTSNKGAEIVAYAKKFLGGKYVSGGNNPSTGVDCSGYTKYVYAHFGYTLNRTSYDQAKNGKEVSRSEMQQGDLIIFLNESKSKVGHVGIYIGNDQFIHAANSRRGIVIDSVYNSYYDARFVSARRII